MATPTKPVMMANAQPSATLILPDATGRFAVRFIMASVSFSTVWLMALALPVTKKPPANRRMIIFQLYSTTFGASR